MVKYKDFTVSDLFTEIKGKRKLSGLEMSEKGVVPVYSSDTTNNGIKGYTELEPDYIVSEKNPVYVVFGDHTKTMNIARNSFCTADNVKILEPKINNDECLLYIFTVWKKNIPDLGYARHWSVAKDAKISLPVTDSGEPDFTYMQERIAELEQERIAELEQERIAELEQYLIAAGLDNPELTDEDKAVLAEKKEYKTFRIGDVFEKLKAPYKSSIRKQDNVSKVQNEEFNLPLINCKYNNNGIMYYGRESDFTWYENVLSIIYNGPPTEGQTYFQEKIGVYTDAYLVGMKGGRKLNREIGLYLTSAMNASIHNEKHRKYSRGDKATWEDKVENDEIELPISSDGSIDFDYMERYIKAIEKLVIKGAVDEKDRIIAETKKVVNA